MEPRADRTARPGVADPGRLLGGGPGIRSRSLQAHASPPRALSAGADRAAGGAGPSGSMGSSRSGRVPSHCGIQSPLRCRPAPRTDGRDGLHVAGAPRRQAVAQRLGLGADDHRGPPGGQRPPGPGPLHPGGSVRPGYPAPRLWRTSPPSLARSSSFRSRLSALSYWLGCCAAERRREQAAMPQTRANGCCGGSSPA